MVYALGARARLFESRYVVHAEFTEVAASPRAPPCGWRRADRPGEGRAPAPHPGGKVRVDFSIAKRFSDRVRKDSVARIETQGLLGDRSSS